MLMHDTLPLFGDAPALESDSGTNAGPTLPSKLTSIPMIDADVKFAYAFYRSPESALLMDTLLREIAWRQETIVLWGKECLQPRLSAWYGDAGTSYRYSGMTLQALAWTPVLLRIRHDVEYATGHRYNSVLLNLYRDQHDSVGWHSDDEPVFGAEPAIASVSLGATRRFRFRHRVRKEQQPISIDLTDGSLLLMAGPTQRYWQHAIGKQKTACGPRINLTFRYIQR